MAVVSAQSGQTQVGARSPAPGAESKPAIVPADAAGQRATLNQYCVTCHNARLKTANLLLDQLDLANLGAHPDIGEKVVRKLRAGLMPPTNNRRPDAATMASLVRGMENTLDRAGVLHLPAPGLHRLNRTEYTNTIRDLLALEVDAAKFLPADDSTRGFDNIAGALTMSPYHGSVAVGCGQDQPARDRRRVGTVASRVRRAGRHGAELPRRRPSLARAAGC
jgi:hypothetical protein